MKAINNMFRSFAAVLAVCSVVAVSCEEPLNPDAPVGTEPVFPVLVEKNDVEPGSVLSLSFEANMDWTVSVPSETLQWFWIEDSSFKVDKLSGKIGEGEKKIVNVSIGVSATEEFDVNRSCEVTLSMGGKSQVIAKYMRPAKARSIAFHAAKVVEGELVKGSDGGYEYESVEAGSVSLIWSATDADFRMPVKVVSNSEWSVSVPEWLELQVPESTVGSVEMVLIGASVEDAAGQMVFMSGGDCIKEIDIEVPSCGKIDLYAAVADANEFMFDDAGEFIYSEESAEVIDLVWTGTDFRLPVRIDAKCDWEVEMPDWLTVRYQGDVPERNAGMVDCVLLGNPSCYPLEDTEGRMVFIFEGNTVREIVVRIPGCKDIFGFGLDMSLSSWIFNPSGLLLTSAGFQDVTASAWISGTEAAAVYAVEAIDGRYVGNGCDWLDVEVQAYVTGADVLQQRTVVVRPSVNAGPSRSAYVLFSNGPSPKEFFNQDGTLKKEMEQYAVIVEQYGSDMDYVTMISSQEEMTSAGVMFEETDNPRLAGWFGETDFMYEMTYSNPYARDKAFMTFSQPYALYKVFDSARQDVTSDDSFWLRFIPAETGNASGVIDMYMNDTPSSAKTTGYVVFYDADGNTLAIIAAVFDPSLVIGTELNVEFIGEAADYAEMVGATLEKVTAESDSELYDMYKEYIAPIYHLTYRTTGFPMRITVPATAVKYNPNPYAKRHNFVINGLDYDESVGEFSLIDGGVDVEMFADEGSYYERGHIFFHAADDTIVLVLICTLDLTE